MKRVKFDIIWYWSVSEEAKKNLNQISIILQHNYLAVYL